MAPTISRGNHIARVERLAQKSRVLRGCPQKYTLILTCGLQNYFSEKSLRRSRKAENFSDDFESAYEVVYISRRFLSDPRVSGPAQPAPPSENKRAGPQWDSRNPSSAKTPSRNNFVATASLGRETKRADHFDSASEEPRTRVLLHQIIAACR